MSVMNRVPWLSLVVVLWMLSAGQLLADVYLYDPSEGTLPTDQLWDKDTLMTASKDSVVAGLLRQSSPYANSYTNWYRKTISFDFASSKATTLEAKLQVSGSEYYAGADDWASGYGLAMTDNVGRVFILGITEAGLRLTNDPNWKQASSTDFVTFDTTREFNTYKLVAQDGNVQLFVNDAQTPTLTLGLGAAIAPGTETNTVRFGDLSPLAGSATNLMFTSATVVPEPASLLLFAGMAGLGLMIWRRSSRRRR